MENKKKQKPIRYFLTALLGSKGQHKFIRNSVNRKNRNCVIHLPNDLEILNNICLILPEDILEALLQITTIVSIREHYSNANITLICEESVAPYFSTIRENAKLLTYNHEDRYLYSEKMSNLLKELHQNDIDACFLLERDPHLALLALTGYSNANLRISYGGNADYPFCNLHINQPTAHKQRVLQNCTLLSTIGIKIHTDLRWTVSANTIKDIEIMFSEFSIPLTSWLGGINIDYIYTAFEKSVATELITKLKQIPDTTWYGVSFQDQNMLLNSWVQSANLPVFFNLKPSRQAALIHKSDCIITGKSHFYELANLQKKSVVGVLSIKEKLLYCKESPKEYVIISDKISKEEIIKRLIETALQIKNSNK